MGSWRTLPLGEALTFQRGFDITKDEQRDGPYSVISSSGPKSTHAEYKVRGPGVIIGRKGSLGTVFYSEEHYWPHDTTLWIKDFHGNDARFAYYFLQTMGFERLDAGASNPSLNRNHIHTIPVWWPPLSIQRRIAQILKVYDELIENSQRRIKILESMARSLYRHWFVHFRFPGHDSVPRVPSPLGEIPQGWAVTTLDSLKAAQPYAINGGPFGSKLVSKDYIATGTPVIRGTNLSESGRFNPTGFVFVSAEKTQELRANLAKPGDIVVTQRGTLGQIAMIPSGIGYEQFVISQSQMKVTLDPAKSNREYVFFYLCSHESNQRTPGGKG